MMPEMKSNRIKAFVSFLISLLLIFPAPLFADIIISSNSNSPNGGASFIYNQTLTLNNGVTISTSGYNEDAVSGSYNNTVSVYGDLHTTGQWSSGISLSNNNTVSVSGDINAAEFQSQGIQVSAGNTINMSGSITTAGKYGNGISGWDNNKVIMSGSIRTTNWDSRGIALIGSGNAAHISGSVSAEHDYGYALTSGLSSGNGEENVFHLLNGTSLSGNIKNNDSDDGGTAILTFGYAKTGDNKVDTTAVDNSFSLTFNDKIQSVSAGNWDGYFAGGTVSLNGSENKFRNIFIGASTFDGADVTNGSGGTVSLDSLAGESSTLNATNTISTSGKILVGTGSVYNLSGTHTHTGGNITVNGSLNLSGGTLINNASSGTQALSSLVVNDGTTGTIKGSSALSIETATINGNLSVSSNITSTDSFNLAAGKTYTLSGIHTHTGADFAVNGTMKLNDGTFLNNASGGSQSIAELAVDTGKTGTLGGSKVTPVATANINGTLNYTASADNTVNTTNLAGALNHNSANALVLTTLNVADSKTGTIGGSGSGSLKIGAANISGNLNTTRAIESTGTFLVDAGDTYTLSDVHTHTGTDFTVNGTMKLNDGTFLNNASGGSQSIAALTVDTGKTGTLAGSKATAVTTANIDGTLNYTASANTTFSTTNLAGTLNHNSANALNLTSLNVAAGKTGTLGGSKAAAVTTANINGTLNYTASADNTFNATNLAGTLNHNSANALSLTSLNVAAGKTGTLAGSKAAAVTTANINGTLNYTASADNTFNTTNLAGTLNHNSANALSLTSLNVAAGKTGTLGGSKAAAVTTANIDGTLNYTVSADNTFNTTNLAGALNHSSANKLVLTTLTVADSKTGTIGGSGSGSLTIGTANISGNLNTTRAIESTGTFLVDAGDTYTLSGTHTHSGTDFTVNGTMKLNDGTFLNNASGGSQSIAALAVDTGKTGTLGGSKAAAVTTANIDGTLNFTASADNTFNTTNLAGTLNQNSANALNLTNLNVATGKSGTLGGSKATAVTTANIDGTLNYTASADNTFNTTNLAGTLNQNSANALNLTNLNVAAGKTGTIGGSKAAAVTTANIKGTLNYAATADTTFTTTTLEGTLNQNSDNNLTLTTLTVEAGKTGSISGTKAISVTTANIKGTLNYAATADTTFTTTTLEGTLNQNSDNSLTLNNLTVAAGKTGSIAGTKAAVVKTADIKGTLNYAATADTTFTTTTLEGALNQNSDNTLTLTTLTVETGKTGSIAGTKATALTTANIKGTLNYTATADTTFAATNLEGTLNQNSDNSLTLATLTVEAGKTGSIAGAKATAVTTANVGGTLNYTASADTTFATTNLTGTVNQNASSNLNLTSLNIAENQSGTISGSGSGNLVLQDADISGSLAIERALICGNSMVIRNGGAMRLSNNLTATGGISNSGAVTVPAGISSTVTGNYSQSGTGAIQVEAASASSYGKLIVTGTADLSSNNLFKVNVTPDDTLAVNNVLSSVLSANTLVADETNLEIEDNSAMWKFVPTVSSNAIDLTVLRQLTCLQAVNESTSVANPAASEGASVLDALVTSNGANPDLQSVLDAMSVLETGEEVAQAVAQTIPSLAASSPAIGFDLALNGATQVVHGRLSGLSGLSAGDPVFEDRYAWVKPFYSKTDQDKRNGIEGYSANTYGMAMGADAKVHPRLRLGGSLSYGTTDIENDSAVSKQQIDIQTWQGTIYAATDFKNNVSLNLIGAAAWNQNESTRNIRFGVINRTAFAEYDSIHTLVDAELLKTWNIGRKLMLGGVLDLRYIFLQSDDYAETGAGGLSLLVQDKTSDTLIASVGGRMAYHLTDSHRLTANADIGYDLLASDDGLVATYSGGGSAFTSSGIKPDELVCRAGFGYEYVCPGKVEIAALYRLESRENFINQSGSVNLRFPF